MTLQRICLPSQPCLSQVVTEDEACKTAELQAKSEARKKAREERAKEEANSNGQKEQKKIYKNPMLARRIQVHPTLDQEKVMLSWFGTRRFVYNQGVEMTREGTEKISMAILREKIKSD